MILSRRVDDLQRRLPELVELDELAQQISTIGQVTIEDEIAFGEHIMPLYSFAIGTKHANAPCVAFIGGVHGLERVGTNLAISYLKTILELIQWDRGLQHLLGQCRIFFLPLLNPAGMYAMTRSNGNGVDLMRNAPIDADTKPNLMLVGGHRLSPRLPWFRGHKNRPMEKEAEALLGFLRREIFPAPFSITLDLHSGFGLADRLWFPFAYTHKPFDRIDHMFELKRRLERSLPNHSYIVEPQSKQYLTHGDLWDYIYLEHKQAHPHKAFLPLTLEMGSWLWIKKNPRQLFSSLGIFNPMMPHRLRRTLRRHLGLLDFLVRAAVSHDNWAHPELLQALEATIEGHKLWYGADSSRSSR